MNRSAKICAICGEPLTPLQQRTGEVCSRRQCRITWRGQQHRGRKRCSSCGRLLTVTQQAAGLVCDRRECRQAEVASYATERRREHQALQLLAEEARDRLLPDSNLAAVAVPNNDRCLRNLPERRLRRFRDHLYRAVREAVESRAAHDAPEYPEDDQYEAPDAPPTELLPVIGNSCATCGGHCCWQGGDHAFVRADTVARYMRANPHLRPRDVVDRYLERLGTKTYEGSCVFHGPTGCGLPREMRSVICNGFLCHGLARLVRKLEASGQRRGLVVSVADGSIVRAATVDDQGRSLVSVTIPADNVDP